MRYHSTRRLRYPCDKQEENGDTSSVTAGQAILKGLAEDGGLYVPAYIPVFDRTLTEMADMSYPALAFTILKPFLTDYDDDTLRACIDKAYAYPVNFDDPGIAPLTEAGGVYFMELYHGRTLAFKDMALSLLPHLLTAAAAKYRPGVETVVLTATSGDTGKAALEGFAHVPGVKVAVFFPEEGVSVVQKRQMVTQEGDNTCVIGVHGNFDDTQTGVKQIFNDPVLAKRMADTGLAFSSANSINIGRLLPQTVYYIYAYLQLMRRGVIQPGDPVDVTVPTGNFGNILAGYYARRMGLPIRTLICASNTNKILSDFFRTGVYDTNRPFHTTISPSMDILISSNLERLLYHIADDGAKGDCIDTEGCDNDCIDTERRDSAGAYVASLMMQLKSTGRFVFDRPLPGFFAAFADEDETRAAIRAVAKNGYIIDTHTAVAYHVNRLYTAAGADGSAVTKAAAQQEQDYVSQIILSTASPFKFARDVTVAIGDIDISGFAAPAATSVDDDGFAALDELALVSHLPLPAALKGLADKKTRHTLVCRVADMQKTLTDAVIFPRTR